MPENENNHPMKEFVRELSELQPALRAFVRDLLAGASQAPDVFQGANLFTPGTHFRARAFKCARYGVLFSAFCLGSALSVRAAQLVYEPFDYVAGSILTSQTGGSGWTAGWTQTGEPCVIGASGLSYVDSIGKILNVSGKHADTTGTNTTRNFRTAAAVPLNDVWISFLYRLPASNARFKGVTFYRASTGTTTPVFAVSNLPSTASIGLTKGAATPVNTQKGTLNTTHFIALRLTKAGGAGGLDRVEVFVDPLLATVPTTADATIEDSNFDFDIIRIAGELGVTLHVDELRVGTTYADVAPYTATDDPDGDGLTNAQEAVLGLNPAVSDAALIAAIRAHPDYFDLHDATGILTLGRGGVVLPQTANDPVNFTLEVQQSNDLTAWHGLQTYNRNVPVPAGKNFVRVRIDDQP